MRIAEEFRNTMYYIKGVNDKEIQDPKEDLLAQAIAF